MVRLDNALILVFLAGVFVSITYASAQSSNQIDPVQPFPGNPYYWQYKGKPVVLLGGTWQDNLFNHPSGLEKHLDLLVSVGGNYVRNTMSHRNVGNVFPYTKNNEGLFDLNFFNNEYWDRFENFMEMCLQRDIIVQLEIWDPWDHFEDHQSFGGWSHHPFNPKNNTTYSPEKAKLPIEANYPPQTKPTNHPFFMTVPELSGNPLVLGFQNAYVNQLLSISLAYPNVIYCINNESGEPLEWSNYWADYIASVADKAGKKVHITEMRRNEDVLADDHRQIFDQPSRYTFLDISQNNAWSGLGQKHYDNLMFVREYIADSPRPINNIKNYGATRHGEEESIARFCRIVFAGAASSRFHRPHPIEDLDAHEASSDFGLGLSPKAQKIIQSMRWIVDGMDLGNIKPNNSLITDREDNEAYLLAAPGKSYALYFPKENSGNGEISLDLTGISGDWKLKWLYVPEAAWKGEELTVKGGGTILIKKPSEGHWTAIILPYNE